MLNNTQRTEISIHFHHRDPKFIDSNFFLIFIASTLDDFIFNISFWNHFDCILPLSGVELGRKKQIFRLCFQFYHPDFAHTPRSIKKTAKTNFHVWFCLVFYFPSLCCSPIIILDMYVHTTHISISLMDVASSFGFALAALTFRVN